jgi:hypothetical protein
MFYNGEEPLYNYYGNEPDMGNFEGWGHFSQIVWKGTTEVACATQYCPNGLGNTGGGVSPYFTVCNYKGPGELFCVLTPQKSNTNVIIRQLRRPVQRQRLGSIGQPNHLQRCSRLLDNEIV